MALIKTQEHIYALMQSIRDEHIKLDTVNPNNVTAILEDIRNVATNNQRSLPLIAFYQHYRRIGGNVLALYGIYRFDQAAFAQMLLQKHEKYGEKPITEWGHLGVFIRIYSKWERYLSLIENPNLDDGGESKDDTLQDILGYCVLGLALEERNRMSKSGQNALQL